MRARFKYNETRKQLRCAAGNRCLDDNNSHFWNQNFKYVSEEESLVCIVLPRRCHPRRIQIAKALLHLIHNSILKNPGSAPTDYAKLFCLLRSTQNGKSVFRQANLKLKRSESVEMKRTGKASSLVLGEKLQNQWVAKCFGKWNTKERPKFAFF